LAKELMAQCVSQLQNWVVPISDSTLTNGPDTVLSEQVYRALSTENGEFVAIKQIITKSVRRDDLASMMSEVELLKELDHPCIVK
jgi:hypothetical protein